MRPTHRTGIWLGMKPAIQRIVIFRFAFRALLESSHRRIRPIVRKLFDDAESGSAIGAVSKRISVPPVLGIKHFPLAIRTDRDIRKNQCGLWSRLVAIPDFDLVVADRVEK